MQITAIKTDKITPNSKGITDVLEEFVPELHDGDIIVVTSKIISLCEGRVVPVDSKDKEDIIAEEAAFYLPKDVSRYNHHFTVTDRTLVGSAGIDESNGDGYYVLYPADVQKSANDIRKYLREKYLLKQLGVIISDSTCQPSRRGSIGIALAHSGFKALKDYIGTPDLFGHEIKVTQGSISGGLAAAATVIMGEGAEQTPIAVISGADFVEFQEQDPTLAEIHDVKLTMEEDLFAPFLTLAAWKRGRGK